MVVLVERDDAPTCEVRTGSAQCGERGFVQFEVEVGEHGDRLRVRFEIHRKSLADITFGQQRSPDMAQGLGGLMGVEDLGQVVRVFDG